MDMQGSRALAVTQQQAWDALNDPEVLKACIPGCDKVEATGPDQFAVGVSVRIGPVSAKFAGKITLTDIVPPQSYAINFEGQGGAAGFGKGAAQVHLTPQGTGCELRYAAQAQVGGKIAQVGQRLVDGVARSMAEDFFKRFDDEMARRFPAAVAAPAAVPAAPAEARPAPVPVWLWVAGAALLAGVLYILTR
ncbi:MULTISPECIES: carbon monoxide dehydrogenase subunit G [Ramlibacter]|uniref:Carbon monoxide dehydrogenase subunit G n=1 Tax=Ramlibacter aquaticus TaxID=2780094 RepID=A0ABR9SDA7_9BURK|nr:MULTISPECIES: carbon monoxide dehydrogenase subunit G [Ramlibacter]MBE7939859.1 carbon monoxide dehydrogenase subunit G [Ramlibacter aquaticus]